MLFWIIAAVLTLGASLAVLLPLTRQTRARDDASHDLEVYRDQLGEVDRDAARGLIAAADAEQARAEIARRIIRLDAENAREPKKASQLGPRLVGMIAVLAVPLLSWGVYTAIGSPTVPSQPLSARLSQKPADSSVDELIARAEAHLVANPSDGRGWDVLAPVYLRIGRANDAVTAYRNAIRILGSTTARQAGLGEAIAASAGGIVTSDARIAFEAALKLEPTDAKARYFLALALAQEGKISDAAAAWRLLAASLPADSPWRAATEQAIAQAEVRTAPVKEAAGAPAPSQDDIDAAASMSSGDRTAMIEGMVATLDEKLRQNPRDPEGWVRLVRSYQVLGKTDLAQDALGRAYAALGRDSEDGRKLTELAGSLGLDVTE
ncbi:c-type cytochrome biogenesis protein CcmI [Aminobacter sp. NyZ550]|uniref:c-type cytochrome biogenesis protein CcmI n=1 Tax=unclassified Aminobacter TaxID=2644704 RepID=UPI0012B11B6B|nr:MULTISPECIES: c-type cytochrome biogenesis protein CcmI [unclassified Aminobacter]MRX33349.1 c-type cytochrome biogenesis protein CcmI [Aminobacter sp. MDW-2]QNH33588.1 c-type cytochrome biogenesis protein CcmI [Aminobacter sp. MDW-2]WAX94569.1 c-type cytochrome biogenesis protein CcmI [Aminobacter sp. NyZ550]WMC98586.1 c-type cytochrome biogenesis protein CcmI [Aminobacter aminovorans]